MRILHLLKHGRRDNGHVHVAVDLACAQAQAGHDVTFAAARPTYAEVMRQHGVRVIELTEPSTLWSGVRCESELWRLCRDACPEIINAHMMSSAVLAYPVAKFLRIALVTTMHNSFDRHSVLMRLGRTVIAVSEAERELLMSRGYPPARVVTVVNGATASPREVITDDRVLARPCVMTLSGLHPRKAVGDVIQAFAQLTEDLPDWHLNVVGAGPDAQRLQALVGSLGLDGVVHLLGSSPAPRRLLEQADIFATATLAEPGGLTVMEARAAGCAIVATSVGGIPETLERGAAGHLIPVHSPGEMAGALRRLMTDSAELETWRERSRRGAEFFTVRRMADDHLRVYESILGRGPVYRPAGVPVR